MQRMQKQSPAWALAFKNCALRLDPRLLVALASLCGMLAWFMPWQALLFFLPPALLAAASAYVLTPNARKALAACMGFVLFWALSYFLLQLWEHHNTAGIARHALYGALIFGGRLFAVLGLASVLPLCLSAITTGRVLTWYMQRPALLFSGRIREKMLEAAWKAGLSLAIMAAFLPQTLRAIKALSQSLKLRAPHLPLRRRLGILGMSALRLMGGRTWDMSVSIAVRGLYCAEPWGWREPVKK